MDILDSQYDDAMADVAAEYIPATPDGEDALLSQRALPLLPWAAALANRDNAPAKCLLLGDSVTEGSYITALGNVWGHRLSAILRRVLPLSNGAIRGGPGAFLPFQNANVAFTAPITFTGAGTAPTGSSYFGFGKRAAALTPGTQSITLTLTAPATSIDLEWVAGNGASDVMTVAVDGGGATTYTGAPANTSAYQRITFAARGTHTVVIGCTNGTVVVNQVFVYDGDESKGIHVVVAGRAGALTSAFIGTDSTSTGTLKQSHALLSPDLVVIELGTNEFLQQVAVATFQANLTTLIGDIKAAVPKACFVVLAPTTPTMPGGGIIAWASYVAAMKTVVGARTDAVFVDLSRRIYPASATDAQALYADAIVHPNDKGAALVAQIIASAITAGLVAGGPQSYTPATTWIAPTLLNGWGNFGSGFAYAGYRLTPDGEVHVQGVIGTGTATAGTVLFNLPAGFRPAANRVFSVASNDAFGEVRVAANGDVTINAGASMWLSLDGIRFLAEG
jgi:lysophospholipase L1-like esterase